MAEGQGLLTKESIQRTIKSKWFLPALGVGGAVVVLLIVANRRKGGSGSSVDEFVPDEMSAPYGNTSEDIGAMFDDLAGSISSQNQQQQDLLASQIDQQNSFLESAISDIYSQLGNIGSTVGYGDPYAQIYGNEGFQYTEPVYNDYAYNDPGDIMTPVLEQSNIQYFDVPKRIAEDKTTALQPTDSSLRDSSGGKTQVTPTIATPSKDVEQNPTKTQTVIGKPTTPGVQAPAGTGIYTPPASPAPKPAPPKGTPAPAPAPVKAPAPAKKPAPAPKKPVATK